MIEFHGHNLLMKYAKEGCSILELGNQEMNLAESQSIFAKEYYSNLGYEHTSVDQNGRNGAIEVDLGKPISFIGKFDIITDFGTTEHVYNAYECLANVVKHTKDGTIIIHKNPKTKNFPGHGNHYFTLKFWEAWAELCKLEVLELYEHPIYHNTIDGWECIAVLKANKETIVPSASEFEKIKKLLKKK